MSDRANQLGHKWEAEYWNRRGELRVCGAIAQAVREVLTEAPAPAQPPTVVHVPIPEGNESRYVEVLREQSLKPCPGCNQSDGWCECPDDCKCAWCVEAAQPVAEPSDNDTINKLRTTLKACRMKFLDYVDIHQEKGNVDKAKSNQRMVDLCTRTLQESQATLPPSSSGLSVEEIGTMNCPICGKDKPHSHVCANCGRAGLQIQFSAADAKVVICPHCTTQFSCHDPKNDPRFQIINTVLPEEKAATWWQVEGRLIDPDTEDVPWYDKRGELAQIAYIAGFTEALSQQAGHTASLEARHRTLLDNYDKMEAERDRLREIVRIGVEECGKAEARADSLSLLLREKLLPIIKRWHLGERGKTHSTPRPSA